MSPFDTRARIALALTLVAATPFALAQKMYKCSDGKGGTTFQQAPCPETAAEAEARAKEKERLQAEEAKKKEEAARKKDEAIQKAKERDKAYQDSEAQRAEERRKAAEAEKKIIEGARQDAGVSAPAAAAEANAADKASSEIAGVPSDIAAIYPGEWRDTPHGGISTAFKNNQIKGCGKYRHRQSSNSGAPMLVQCTEGGGKPAFYYVYPATGGVTPARF